jgi:hypothetical protein
VLGAFRRLGQKFLLTSSHSVKPHARFDARQSPPQPSDDVLSLTEQKLQDWFKHRMTALIIARNHALRGERVNAISTDLAAEERSFDDIVRDTKNDIWVARLKFNPTWNDALEHIRQRRKDLDHFKREHLLQREAAYHSPLLAIGVLSVACVAETVVNATLFAQVSTSGLMGGATFSIALSLPNLALGFIAGFCGFRGLHHVQPMVRWSAAACTVVCLALGAIWNLFVAHLRTLAELRAEVRRPFLVSDWHDLVAQISVDPAAILASPHAIILMLVGLLVFVVAAHDGYDLVADRYPGFARVARRLQSAIADADNLKWRCFKQLTALTQKGLDRVQRRVQAIEKKCNEALHILDRARTIIGRFNRRAADDLWVYRATVREYQSLNRRLRGDLTVPRRFDEPLANDIELPEYDWRGMREKIRAARQAATDAADGTAARLADHLLMTMQQIDGQASNPNAMPSLPPPPLSQPAKEAA